MVLSRALSPTEASWSFLQTSPPTAARAILLFFKLHVGLPHKTLMEWRDRWCETNKQMRMKNTDVKNNPFVMMYTHIITSHTICFVSSSFFKDLVYIYSNLPPLQSLASSPDGWVAPVSMSYIICSHVFMSFGDSGFQSVLFIYQEVCKIIYLGRKY